MDELKGKFEIEKIENLDSKRKKDTEIEQLINVPASQQYREISSVPKWRSAISSAERPITNNPTYYELQRLYTEVASDSEVKSCTNIRTDNIISKNCILYKDGEILEDVNIYNFFKQEWMYDFMTYSLESTFYGYSCIRIGDIDDVDDITKTRVTEIENVGRANVNPKLELLNKNYAMNDGVDLNSPEYKDVYILVRDKDGLNKHYKGAFSDIFPYFQDIKDAQHAWGDFIKKYGSGALIIKTELTNDVHRNNLINFAKNFQCNSFALMGSDDEVEVVQPGNSSGESFEKIIAEMKGNISKILLGSESLGSEQSFVGSVEASERLLGGISRSDMNLIESIINNDLIPRLITLGVKWLEGITYKFDTAVKEDPEQKLEQVKVLTEIGYQLDERQIEDIFGLKINGFETPKADAKTDDKKDDKK